MSVDKHADRRCREMTRDEKIEFILLQTEIGSKTFNNSILDLMNGAGMYDGNPIWDFLGLLSKLWEQAFDSGFPADKAAELITEGIYKTSDKILNQMCYAAHTMDTN